MGGQFAESTEVMDDPPSPGSFGGPQMEGQLIACVQESLALYLHENARFMAERLVAEFPREVRQACKAAYQAGKGFAWCVAPAENGIKPQMSDLGRCFGTCLLAHLQTLITAVTACCWGLLRECMLCCNRARPAYYCLAVSAGSCCMP